MSRFLKLVQAVAITATLAAPIAAWAVDDYSNFKDARAHPVLVGEIYSGNIESDGDVDVFRITTTVKTVLSSYTLGVTNFNPKLTIGTATTELATEFQHITNNPALGDKNVNGQTSTLKWTPLASNSPHILAPGTYYFTVSSTGIGTGSYRFGIDYWDVNAIEFQAAPTVYTSTTNDYAGNTIWHAWQIVSTLGNAFLTTGIPHGGIVEATSLNSTYAGSGSIDFKGDIDYIPIKVSAAGLLTAYSSVPSGSTTTDAYGYLRDVNGLILNNPSADDDAAGNLQFKLNVRVNPGIYYLEIRHFNRMTSTGAYIWNITLAP